MKKVKIFLGAFLCMNFLTMSGCDKVVYSAVVEEKDKTDSKTEEHKEKENSSEDSCRTGTGSGKIPDNNTV